MNNLLDDIASGQKIIIYSIIANFIFGMVRNTTSPYIFIIIALIITGFAMYGVYRLCRGLQHSTVMKILLMILVFVPLINLIMYIVLSLKATKRLRDAGYEVGFFGVKN